MIGTIIGLIILCVIIGFVWWAAQRLLALVPLAEPFATIVHILMMALVLLVAIYAVITLLGMVGIHVPIRFGQ